jgi:four helix bundle protein
MAKFEALEVALEMVRELAKLLPAIERHDKALARQIREAGSSSPACFAEGARRVGRDRLHLYRVAGGSAAEVVVHLRTAVAWTYVTEAQAKPAADLGDRVAAMGWRLTTPRRR